MTNEIMIQRESQDGSPAAAGMHSSTANGHEALFPAQEGEGFRARWHDIQGGFVDEPREAVQKADELVATAVKRLADIFAAERAKLEADWSTGNDVSTEDLRQALRRYRLFFDRLLTV
jgi:hypothetical protein